MVAFKFLDCDDCEYYRYVRCAGDDCFHPKAPGSDQRGEEELAENRDGLRPKWVGMPCVEDTEETLNGRPWAANDIHGVIAYLQNAADGQPSSPFIGGPPQLVTLPKNELRRLASVLSKYLTTIPEAE
jgi:hypothetical protein